ncbi:TCFL5 protein, partial [Rhinopomastus cyanomelas]|nr:TCFL5 protein [Rhinopomastus cyanomelas]
PQSTVGAADPAAAGVGPGGSSGQIALGEHNLSFTTTDVSLVEMMEVEYTQLQHMYSHTEAQASRGDAEARLGAFSFSGNSADLAPLQPSPLSTSPEGCLSSGAGNPFVYPIFCQSGLSSEGGVSSSIPHLGCADFQELRMMLLGECNLPLNKTDKTLNSGSGEVPGHSLVKVKCENFEGENKEGILVKNLVPEPRPKSAVRVRLEERFNSIQTENPRCQERQECGVTLNNLVTLIGQPSELVGVPAHQQQKKCAAASRKSKTAPTTSLQFTYPLLTVNAAGSTHLSQAQTSGTPCTLLEAARHQDLEIPKTLSFGYQEVDSTQQSVAAVNKSFSEEVWIKVGEDSLCKQTINSSCGQMSPLDPNADRKPFGEIQNLHANSRSSTTAPGSWPPAQPRSRMQRQGGSPDEMAQRRERHNRLERDRRRRIRVCCDELNLLVPFCTIDTDKATTLQRTTAFLKYIQERHGDSLKQEFESVFSGKTGKRLKVASSDSFVMPPVQENTHGYGDQV